MIRHRKLFVTSLVVCWLASSGLSRGALLTDFSGSFALYRACVGTHPTSLCFAMFFDPQQVLEGQVTAFIEADEEASGGPRFGSLPIVFNESFYSVGLVNTTITDLGTRQRIESQVMFNAAMDRPLPPGPVTIFSYEVGDLDPFLNLGTVQLGFFFQPGDFITLLDDVTNERTTISHDELPPVFLRLEGAIPEPSGFVTAIGCCIGCWVLGIRFAIRRKKEGKRKEKGVRTIYLTGVEWIASLSACRVHFARLTMV